MHLTEHYSLRAMDSEDYYNIDDFNKNTEAIDQLIYGLEYKINRGTNVVSKDIILPSTGWNLETRTCIVQIPEVKATSTVIIGLSMLTTTEDLIAILSNKINVSAIADGQLTFICLYYGNLDRDLPIAVSIFN